MMKKEFKNLIKLLEYLSKAINNINPKIKRKISKERIEI
jgi:phage-related minor tail protein